MFVPTALMSQFIRINDICFIKAFIPKQLAVSLFENTQVGKMRNSYEHQKGKIQITILILR